MSIVLMGLRGSGKTTLGRAAADRLGVGFADLDDATPAMLGARDVRDAWDRFGEQAFRDAERRTLENGLRGGIGVLALGGGTPTAPGAAELLREASRRGCIRLIYLRADAATLRERLRASDNRQRPAILGTDPIAEIERVLAIRDPLYIELADAIIELAGRTQAEVLEELIGLATNGGGDGAQRIS